MLFFFSTSLESICELAQIIAKLRTVGLQIYETLTTLHVIFKYYDQKQIEKKERLVFVQHHSVVVSAAL